MRQHLQLNGVCVCYDCTPTESPSQLECVCRWCRLCRASILTPLGDFPARSGVLRGKLITREKSSLSYGSYPVSDIYGWINYWKDQFYSLLIGSFYRCSLKLLQVYWKRSLWKTSPGGKIFRNRDFLACVVLIGQRGLTIEVISLAVAFAYTSQPAFAFCWCGRVFFLDRSAAGHGIYHG